MTDSNSNEDESLDLNTLATISRPYKVLGRLPDVNGIGVVGNSTASSGNGIGVKGIAESSPAIEGGSGPPVGVVGETTSQSGRTYGVEGKVPSNSGAAVIGRATNTNGFADGVVGIANGNGDGIVSEGDASLRGDTYVGGSLEVTQVLMTSYQAASQSIGNSLTKVQYTNVLDDFSGWEVDESNTYTVQDTGYFQVTAQIQWSTVPSGGNKMVLEVQKDDGNTTEPLMRNVKYVASDTWTGFTMDTSRPVFLVGGDKVSVKASQAGSSSESLETGRPNTYFTISRLG